MTTVDSWPKTLPMLSARSWNSTTETHLSDSLDVLQKINLCTNKLDLYYITNRKRACHSLNDWKQHYSNSFVLKYIQLFCITFVAVYKLHKYLQQWSFEVWNNHLLNGYFFQFWWLEILPNILNPRPAIYIPVSGYIVLLSTTVLFIFLYTPVKSYVVKWP